MAHPLDRFKFCPACGSANWAIHNFKSKQCADCGFVYYANPAAATAAFILRTTPDGREEMLAVRRAKEPQKDTLDLPGGFLDMEEDLEQGMRREIEEETGLKVDRVDYLFSSPNEYLYSGMLVNTIDADYLVRVPYGVEAVGADDAADARWIALDEVNPDDFGLQSIRRAVIRFLKEKPWINKH